MGRLLFSKAGTQLVCPEWLGIRMPKQSVDGFKTGRFLLKIFFPEPASVQNMEVSSMSLVVKEKG